jgi:hypothetical protein
MKLLFILLFSLPAFAYEISFTGPCDQKPIIAAEMGSKFATVGDLTVHFLRKNKIPFKGSERGINTVFNTPVGDAAIEVISNTEMRAYGWCFFVDDFGPDVFADEYPLNASIQKIEWIFGFAHYKNGEWLTSCTPAFTVKPYFLCKP